MRPVRLLIAARWLAGVEVDRERGVFVHRSEAERLTLGKTIEHYQDEVLGEDSEKRGRRDQARKRPGHARQPRRSHARRRAIQDTLVGHYGDPRLTPKNWRSVSESVRRVVLSWLAKSTSRCRDNAGVFEPALPRYIDCLNYQLWMGGFTDHAPLAEPGATVVPFGVGETRLLIRTIQELGITAISCTPSYPAVLDHVIAEHFPALGRATSIQPLRPGCRRPDGNASLAGP